jgi:selenophosphate synthase
MRTGCVIRRDSGTIIGVDVRRPRFQQARGAEACRGAGIPVAGGHSIDSPEPIYGLVALGLVHPKRVKRNADARAGDRLVLGKPLGVGVLSAALKKGELSDAGYEQMVAWRRGKAPDRAFTSLGFERGHSWTVYRGPLPY